MNKLAYFSLAQWSKHKRFLLLGVVVLMLANLLGACGGLEPGGMANCSPDEMSAPVLIAPGGAIEPWHILADDFSYSFPNPPLFQWSHQGTCIPTEYRVIISRIPAMPYGDLEYTGSLVMDVRTTGTDSAGPTIVYEDGTTSVPHSWLPSDPLNPGTYYWRVIPYSRSVRGEYSDWMTFRVGPLCFRDDGLLAPRLLYPRNGQTIVAGRVQFMWLDDSPCAIQGLYYLQYSEYSYFPEGDTFGANYPYGRTWPHQFFYMQPCKRYFWRVNVGFSHERPTTSSEIFSFTTTHSDGTSCSPDAPQSATSSPVSPTASSPAELLTPMVLVRETATCRAGPTADYPLLDTLTAGTQLPIQGRNQAGDSWLVEDSNIAQTCWVQADKVELLGDASLVEVIDPDPPTLPTAVVRATANCRSGPTADYLLLDILMPGTQLPIQGQNRAGDAWLVEDSNIHGTCWIYGNLVDVIGNTSLVMIVDPEPPSITLPTATATTATTRVDCSQYKTNPLACNNNQACWWDPKDPPNSNGSCKNR